MTTVLLNRRNLLAAGGSVVATAFSGLLVPARAQGFAPTRSMQGGSNNYLPGASILDRSIVTERAKVATHGDVARL